MNISFKEYYITIFQGDFCRLTFYSCFYNNILFMLIDPQLASFRIFCLLQLERVAIRQVSCSRGRRLLFSSLFQFNVNLCSISMQKERQSVRECLEMKQDFKAYRNHSLHSNQIINIKQPRLVNRHVIQNFLDSELDSTMHDDGLNINIFLLKKVKDLISKILIDFKNPKLFECPKYQENYK